MTAAAAASDRKLELVGFYRRMAGAVALAVGAAALVIAFAAIIPGGSLFRCLAPGCYFAAIAWWVSRARVLDQDLAVQFGGQKPAADERGVLGTSSKHS